MKRLLGVALLVAVGVMAWRIGGALSTDAMGMAVGIVFGVLAGIPSALLVLATGRRRAEEEAAAEAQASHVRQLPAYPYQSPVIVVTGQPQSQSASQGQLHGGTGGYPPVNAGPAWGSGSRERQFLVVGEEEQWLR